MLLVMGAGAGCKRSPHTGAGSAGAQAAAWVSQTPLLAHVPATARSVIVARNLTRASQALRFVAAQTPLSAVPRARDIWKNSAGFDLFDSAQLTAAGVAADAPVVLFYDRGYWVFAAQLADASKADTALKALKTPPSPEASKEATSNIPDPTLPGAGGRRFKVEKREHATLNVLRLSHAEASPAPGADNLLGWVGWDTKVLLGAVRAQVTDLNRHDVNLPSPWLSDSSRPRFAQREDMQNFLVQLSPHGDLLGVVRPGAWLTEMSAQGHAQQLLHRLLSQVGPVGVALSTAGFENSIHLYILTPGNPRAPAVLNNLGRAQGSLELPDGLIEPGVLAVARMSVDPEQFYTLLVSTLPADQRREIEQYWQALDRELSIDALGDVLANLRGHAVVVAYGLDPDSLRNRAHAQEAPGFLSTIKLQNTREAVLLPIKAREPIERVLDALTTVSKRRLSRQVAGHTLQYAWLEDGSLKWALILSEHSLIFVDSAVAFEHAVAFERGEHSNPEALKKLGIERLFQPQDDAGLYLDAASLSAILTETAPGGATDTWAAWLKPFQSITATTRQDPQSATGITEILVRLAPAH